MIKVIACVLLVSLGGCWQEAGIAFNAADLVLDLATADYYADDHACVEGEDEACPEVE